MAREPSQKLVDYGIIAGILFGAYVLWNFVYKTEKKECPVGQHAVNPCEGQIGWVGFLCTLGRNVTGAALDCKPDTVIPDDPGCANGNSIPALACKAIGRWNETTCSCNPEETTCPTGYQWENGRCTAINPGGCVITDAICKTADPRTYLNLDTCKCTSSNYTDECVLGDEKCAYVPGVNGPGRNIKLKCIFVPTFGNRMQVKVPQELCGESPPPPPDRTCLGQNRDEAEQYIMNEVTRGTCLPAHIRGWITECSPRLRDVMEASMFCDNQNIGTNIVDCGNGCGLVDLNNPPGTTCEEVCKPIWTPGCVQNVAECRRLNENTPGGLFAGFMNRAQCEGAGYIFVNNPPNYCANQARLDYDKQRAEACCW